MVFFLINFLQANGAMKIPNVFVYTSTRMILAALTSLFICIFLGPRFIKKLYEMKIGQPIRMEECPLLGKLHHNKKDTPTMGGILILFSILLSMWMWMDLTHVFTLHLFLVTVILGAVGAYDDYLKLKYRSSKGLSGRKKLLVQGAVSLLVASYMLSTNVQDIVHTGTWYAPPVVKEQVRTKSADDATVTVQKTLSFKDYASRLYIPFVKDPLIIASGAFTIAMALFMLFVIAGASNAVNLTDGLDGLASGCLIMVGICFAITAFVSNNIDIAYYLNIPYVEGSGEIAIFLCAFIGACLGFLWYNGHPAQVFMGDTGSLALGGMLGTAAVLLKRELLLGIAGGIFVAEALSVILQVASYRLRDRKRIFLCAPLHHHFEYKGWPETKVVIRFWIIGFILAIVGIASLKFQ